MTQFISKFTMWYCHLIASRKSMCNKHKQIHFFRIQRRNTWYLWKWEWVRERGRWARERVQYWIIIRLAMFMSATTCNVIFIFLSSNNKHGQQQQQPQNGISSSLLFLFLIARENRCLLLKCRYRERLLGDINFLLRPYDHIIRGAFTWHDAVWLFCVFCCCCSMFEWNVHTHHSLNLSRVCVCACCTYFWPNFRANYFFFAYKLAIKLTEMWDQLCDLKVLAIYCAN
jgi:hypothetical protein